MTDAVSLAVRPGEGRLGRTRGRVLFAAAAGDPVTELWEAFRAPESADDALDALTGQVVGREFDVPGFVAVTWQDRVRVMVFGDIEVRTDHPALPMVSGAASETWVEHTLRGGPDTVTVHVDAPDVHDTDLQEGIAPASGFELAIAVTAAPAEPAPRTGRSATTPAAAPTEPATTPGAPAVPPAAPSSDASPTPPRTSGEPVDPTPTPAPHAAQPPSAVDPDDPEASLAAIQAAAVSDDDTAAASPPPASPPPAPAPAEPVQDVQPSTSALVEAVTCAAGHLNRPGSTSCRVCGEPVDPEAAVDTHARPVMGVLRVEGGDTVPIEATVVLGRRPRAGEDAVALTVPGEKVSRTHAEVTVRGWDVYVQDLGSTNGTHVVARSGDEPLTLEPEIPTRIQPGAVVYIGSTAVAFDPPDE